MAQGPIFLFLLPVYAITIMASLLDLHRSDFTKKKTCKLVAFTIVIILVNVFVFTQLGRGIYIKFYVLWMQLPVYFGFRIISRYRGIKLLLTLLTMIIFAALPVKIVMVFRIITKGNAVFMLIGFVLAYLIVLVLIIRFLRPGYIYMLKWGESKVFWKLSIIPLLFYVYSYLNTGYNFMQTSSMDKFFLQCIPSLIVLLSYILLMDIFKSTNEKQLLKSQQNLVELQLTAATEQIKQLETVERQSAIYRHDLRHHMNYLDVCITENKLMEALGYIAQTCENIDNAHVVQYSQNEPVNLIVSSYVGKAKEKGIKMALDITATDFSRFQIVDLCSLLSNSLENAITACGQMKNVEGRYIKLRMYERSNKLCLDIRNSYAVEPVFEHNIPVSQQEGHGIGVQSILHAVEKYHGVCGFSAKDGVFVFQMSM